MLINFGAYSRQIRVMASNSLVEVHIHRFAVIGVGMVALQVFQICREH